MDFPKQDIHMKITETNENNFYYYFILIILIILAYLFYLYVYTEDFFQDIERRLIEFKNNMEYYANQILLKMNMEGDAIKTIQVSSI
jgi:hypothetical protein